MNLKRVSTIIFILGLLSIAIAFIISNKGPKITYTTVKAVKGDIIQTVSETGTVKSASEIDLSFLNTGKIKKINFKIGDKVSLNQVIAELDYQDLILRRNESQANLDVARENYKKLITGATAEEIAISRASLSQAKTAYESAQKELEKISESAKEQISQAEKDLFDLESDLPEDTTTYEQSVSNAEQNLVNTKATYQNALDNASSNSLVVIENKMAIANVALDVVNTVLTDEDGDGLISIKNPVLLRDAENYYSASLEMLSDVQIAIESYKTSTQAEALESLLESSIDLLQEIFSSLNSTFFALEESILSSDFTQTDLDTLKTSISAQQTLISAAITETTASKQSLESAILNYDVNVSTSEDALAQAVIAYDDAIDTARNTLTTTKLTADQQITSAESRVDTAYEAWQVTQSQLSKILAPPSTHDTSLSLARIRQAEAALDSINNQINNSIIQAPISGTINKINFELGEQVLAGANAISMAGENNFNIEVLVSEADIIKLKKGDMADITLDAFGDDIIFDGKVSFIEPAETTIQEVIYYKVDVELDEYDYDIKSGMTANVDFYTGQREGVIMIPVRAISEKEDGTKFVRVLGGDSYAERVIQIGLRGDGGAVEVLSGLVEDELVITKINEN